MGMRIVHTILMTMIGNAVIMLMMCVSAMRCIGRSRQGYVFIHIFILHENNVFNNEHLIGFMVYAKIM